ncbi:MAG: DNA-directed RNA polymerase subunit H [Candidatus Thermoplasmatota archaeon]|nr:DNA-directed RNA polymerase subunit H [Candidatus Thermoplasmatota archaeon]MCL5666088.1 DNA-directed RNA polymerase subunit H [Candidatus Thermoplasmatota archaeon]
MGKFNVLNHELVPEHYVLDSKEEEKVLRELGITKDLLPKINKSDPAIIALEQSHGDINPGSVIKIVRKSPTAGISVYYRVVVSGETVR